MGNQILRLALAVLAAALVMGCGVSTPSPDWPPTSASKIVLRVATGDSGEGLEPHRQIIARFQKENPNIEIKLESVSGSNYYQALWEQIERGAAPDIMQIGDDAVPQFVRKGAFTDLGPWLRGAEPLDQKIYLPGVLQPGAWEGKQYFLPKDFTPLAVYYNKLLFDRYQVPYPREGWTWDDLLATAKALTVDQDRDGQPEVWGIQLPAAWTSGFEYWAAAAGGMLIGEDGKQFRGSLDSPQTAAALQFYAGLYQTAKVAPPPVGVSLLWGGNTEFVSGKAAMTILGHWPAADYRRNPAISLGIVGMPSRARRANVLFWSGFGIYSGSEQKEAAWRFLRFYCGVEGSQTWKNWGLPPVASVAEASGMTQDPLEKVWFNELGFLTPRAYIFGPHWGETGEPALKKALEKAIADPRADIRALLQEAAREAEAALKGIK